MEYEIIKFLDAGGNLALFALVYIMWRFDRRLVKLETVISGILKEQIKIKRELSDT